MGKKHHYVPQFYLRNFSSTDSRKLINCYSIKNNEFYRNVSIKNQACRQNYYDIDGKAESFLSCIEGLIAPVISRLIGQPGHILNYDTKQIILHFLVLSYLRTTKFLESHEYIFSQMANYITHLHPEHKSEIDAGLRPNPQTRGNLTISSVPDGVKSISDLHVFILQNDTERDFITSDSPVNLYNQFLEEKNYLRSSRGTSLLGTTFFLPLSSKTIVFAYDSSVYDFILPKLSITNRDDINSINKIQMMHGEQNIFYQSRYSEKWINKYKREISGYRPAKNIAVNFARKAYEYGEYTKFEVVSDFREESKETEMLMASHNENMYAGIRLSFMDTKRHLKSMPLDFYPRRLSS